MGTLTDMVNRFWGAILSWINGTMWLAVAIGVFMIIYGVYNLGQSRHGNSGGKNGVYLLIFGTSLISLIAFLGTGSETFFGTNQTEIFLTTL